MRISSSVVWCLHIAVTICVLTGCATPFFAIESRQVGILKEVLFSSTDSGPQPNWVLHWLGEQRPVYAINVGKHILFANESGDLVRFNGSQVVEARRLLPGDSTMMIEKNESLLVYRLDREVVSTHLCQEWKVAIKTVTSRNAHRQFVQRCETDGDRYENYYSTDQANQLTSLNFLIHPAYPPLRIKTSPVLD